MLEEDDSIFEASNQKRLIEQIRTAPDCRIFGTSKFNQGTIQYSMLFSFTLIFLFSIIVLSFYNPSSSPSLLILIIMGGLISLSITSYMNFSHNYFKTYVSELGIAKDSKWDTVAFPWESIEYIEIKNKGSDIDYIIFRSSVVTLGYRNSYFAHRLTLEIISEYIGGIENWYIFDDFAEFEEEMKSDRVYMIPGFDKVEGQKRFEEIVVREWVGEEDFDASQTHEQPSAKSDEEIYELIVNDPQCECVLDYGRFNRIISKFKVIGGMFIVAVSLIFLGMLDGPFSGFMFITGTFLFILIFYSMFKGYEKLIISPLGIARYHLGSPEAVEWQHVEFIDFHAEDEVPIPFEFFGNQRRIFCPPDIYKQLVSMDMIRNYIQNLDEWKMTRRANWEEGVFRLVRQDV